MRTRDCINYLAGTPTIKQEPTTPVHNTSDAKYSTFSEFIYGALQALGGNADLQELYAYVSEHANEVDKKCMYNFVSAVWFISV